MRQVIFAGVVLCFAGLQFAVIGDEPKKALDKDSIAGRFAELKKQFEDDEKEIKKKLAEAKEPDDEKQQTFLLKELCALRASDAVELALENPKDEASLDAAVFALKLLGQQRVTGDDMDKATNYILENHVNSPKIEIALGPMSEAGLPGQRFLKAVVEKTTNDQVKGLALYYSAVALDEEIGALEAQGSEQAAKRLQAEAIDKIDQAVKLAPNAKVGNDTLSKAAAATIASLKIGVGQPAPDVEGFDLDGKKVKLASYRGKVTLLDFWATWCPPCLGMIPHEREMTEKLAKKPFTILAVNVDDKKETLTEFMESEKLPWAHWWDGSKGPLAKTFKVRGYPTLYLIDVKGIIRKKWLGAPKTEVLDKAIEELVAEAEKK